MQILMKKEDALKKFKTRTNLAKAIGITKQAISQWGDLVPQTSAYKILIINPDIPHIQTASQD